jgi:hypothetical protein
MDILLTDIQDRLTAQVPALKYIDEDWGQLDDYSPNFPVKWPCALIDCFNAAYENTGNKTQLGLAMIRVRVADIKLSNSSAKAPAAQKSKSNSFRVLINDIYKALHGWSGHNHYSALIRVSERRIPRNDGVREQEVMYSVEIKDAAAAPPKLKVKTTDFGVTIDTTLIKEG